MAVNKIRTAPTWSEVKAKLALFDRAGLMGLLSDLHSLSRDNQAFLHARLGLGPDPLAPYKATISRWICPDVIRGQVISVTKAKKAISDYRKAIGLPVGVAELSVFYCESAARLLSECGMEDEGYFAALVRMFDQALAVVAKLDPSERKALLQRLDAVRSATDTIGWGVKDAMDELWAEHVWEDWRTAIQERTFARTRSATKGPSPITSAVRGAVTARVRFASDVDLLCDLDRIIDLDAEVSNGALDLRVSQ